MKSVFVFPIRKVVFGEISVVFRRGAGFWRNQCLLFQLGRWFLEESVFFFPIGKVVFGGIGIVFQLGRWFLEKFI